ncbi:MAG: glycosyltransferase family 4 protein, partial [Planctomycetota bacterium]
AGRRNVPLAATPGLWRVQSWRIPRLLTEHLRTMSPPRRAFIGVSMYWVVAARRAWPDVPVAYLFPCLLTNCLPFTWAGGRAGLWRRLDFAGIRRAEHAAFAAAHLTLTPTRHAKDEILGFHDMDPQRIVTCLYGCDPPGVSSFEFPASSFELRGAETRNAKHAMRRKLGVGPDGFLALLVGLMDANKAFDWAIRELPATDPRVQLVLLGDGPQRADLERLALRLGVAPRVRFPGVQSQVFPWYTAADCVVSTSHYDTFPNVVLEAMYCDRPVVVPRHDPPHVYAGAAEIVSRHGGGRLYDRRRAGSLAGVLSELCADPGETGALGERAGWIARRLFRWDECVERVSALAG